MLPSASPFVDLLRRALTMSTFMISSRAVTTGNADHSVGRHAVSLLLRGSAVVDETH